MAGWDDMGIDRDAGRLALDSSDKFKDAALQDKRNEFVVTAMKTYLQSLKDRKPATLETKKKIPKQVILEFFDACNTHMDLPEYKEELALWTRQHGQMPNQLVIDAQKDWLEILGWEREFGCQCLNDAGADYAEDEELKSAYVQWRSKAEMTCKQAVMDVQMAAHQSFVSNPEVQALSVEAKVQIDSMSPKERGEFLQKFVKKFQVFMSLPMDARSAHMAKLNKAEKMDLVKA